MDILEKLFKLHQNGTNIRTEIIAGLTTFFTMSYLLVLSPKLLEYSGLELGSSLIITALIVFICSIIMALIANKPYAVAPFLGETAFIAFTIVGNLGFSIKTALASIFISGIILLFMTLSNIRTYIVEQIPENIKISFCTGLGLFFIFIALRDIGIVKFTTNNIPLEIGNFTSISIILGIFCCFYPKSKTDGNRLHPEFFCLQAQDLLTSVLLPLRYLLKRPFWQRMTFYLQEFHHF